MHSRVIRFVNKIINPNNYRHTKTRNSDNKKILSISLLFNNHA